MHLLLLLPSFALLCLLFFHSWKYRGRRTTLWFFISCFLFGVLRGNVINYICIQFLGNRSLPYVFTNPVIRIYNASLQECIGWLFAVYLSWSAAEWLLSYAGKNAMGVLRIVSLTAVFMGSISYAVEAAASGVNWWVWGLSINNPIFIDVPYAGIIAWISVIYDFLLPFLLIRHGIIRGWRIALLFLIFPVHMLLHLELAYPLTWFPVGYAEFWHWLIISLLIWGLFNGGARVESCFTDKSNTGGLRRGPAMAILVSATGFVAVLLIADLLVARRFELMFSLAGYVTGMLFFNRKLAWTFSLALLAVLCFTTQRWNFALIPLLTTLVFALGTGGIIAASRRKQRFAALAAIVCLTVPFFAYSVKIEQRKNLIFQIGGEMLNATSSRQFEQLAARLPSPPGSSDIEAYSLLGQLAYGKGNYQAAEKFIVMAIDSDPGYSRSYYNAALVYLKLGQAWSAVRALEKELALNPFSTNSYLVLGELYERLDSLQLAEKIYETGARHERDGHKNQDALETLRAGNPGVK